MTPPNPLKGDWKPDAHAFRAFATPPPRTTTMDTPPEPEPEHPPYLTKPGTHERRAELAIMDTMDAADVAYDRCDTGTALAARGYVTVARELLETARNALVKEQGR